MVYERMRAALNSLIKMPTSISPAAAPALGSHGQEQTLSNRQQQQQQEASEQQHRRHGKRQRQQEEPDTSPPGTLLARVLVDSSAAAAAGPSSLIPPAAVEWAQGVQQQQQRPTEQQQGTAGSISGAESQGLAASDPDLGLNRSQVAAIASCLLNKVSLIHGPPGTGGATQLSTTTSTSKGRSIQDVTCCTVQSACLGCMQAAVTVLWLLFRAYFLIQQQLL